jgi:TolB-like protein
MKAAARRSGMIAVLAVLVCTISTVALAQDMRPASAALAAKIAASGRKTVAVVDFTDLQGCVTELGRYMAEDISVALLDNAKGFEVIDRTNLKILMQEHKLASSGIIDPATARKLGQVAGVDALVTGTIAPLSDSVHVSAKVLDTETAKMLGGVTAEIPRTKTVEELLAKGVANCGAAPPVPGNQGTAQGQGMAPGQGSVNSIQRPPAVSSMQVGDFVVTIESCHRAGDMIQCSGSVMNTGKRRERFLTLSGGSYRDWSYMTDNLGNRSWFDVSGPGQSADFEPDLPLNISLSCQGLAEEATSVWITLGTAANNGNTKTTLKNIPIRAK